MAAGNFSYFDFIKYVGVSRETFSRFQAYAALLEKWQKKINLIGDATLTDIWIRHIIDSAQLFSFLSPSDTPVDIGTGAGFPGLILAMMGNIPMTLIESDGRKIAFLKEAARVTETTATIIHSRVESIDLTPFSLITARALAPLNMLFDLLKNTLNNSHKMLLLKGKNIDSELKAAKTSWSFDYTSSPSLTDKNSAILYLQNFTKAGVL